MRDDTGLKCLQWLMRGIQLGASLLVLAVYSYFLATLAAYGFQVSISIRAVEGISGSAVLYTLLGVLLVCCMGGFLLASVIAMVLDLAFIAAFIYVAVANKHGVGSCHGDVGTPYGNGSSQTRIKGKKRGSLALPTYGVACQLQKACLAAAIIAILFLLISIAIGFSSARFHYRKRRDDNKQYGYGYAERGLFLEPSRVNSPDVAHDDLPNHISPSEVSTSPRQSIDDTRETYDEYRSTTNTAFHGGNIS